MIYNELFGKKISMLGFGAMRLPKLSADDADIDIAQTEKMIDLCMEGGVNYFDTAYPYHGGKSEGVLAKALKKYPRDSYFLADKYPGHQITEEYHPEEIFEDQLKKCDTEYFDFYLLHNFCENSFDTYTSPKWGIVDYFVEQKKLGRIKHLGISTHAQVETLKKILELYGDVIEFCQIQLNYLDWTLQDAKSKVELLSSHNIPVWVMEPVRGGKLAHYDEVTEQKMRAMRPEDGIASWGYRWLQDIPGVKLVLTGASSLEQITENIATFAEKKCLSETEKAFLQEIAEGMKNSVPCTGCRYCTKGCPQGIDIPKMISLLNEFRVVQSVNTSMYVESLPETQRPSACIGCGACAAICPQSIDISGVMKEFADRMAGMKSWAQISKERAEIARKLKEQRSNTI